MAETRLAPWTPTQERMGTVFIKWMTAANIWLFRVSGGRLGAKFRGGAPICLVTAKGRKSGALRTVALLYLEDGENVVLVASKGGMSHHPQWYLNMEANPDVEVEIGGDKKRMRARRASPAEKASYWPRLVAMYRDYDDYQARTTREIPVMVLSPA